MGKDVVAGFVTGATEFRCTWVGRAEDVFGYRRLIS